MRLVLSTVVARDVHASVLHATPIDCDKEPVHGRPCVGGVLTHRRPQQVACHGGLGHKSVARVGGRRYLAGVIKA